MAKKKQNVVNALTAFLSGYTQSSVRKKREDEEQARWKKDYLLRQANNEITNQRWLQQQQAAEEFREFSGGLSPEVYNAMTAKAERLRTQTRQERLDEIAEENRKWSRARALQQDEDRRQRNAITDAWRAYTWAEQTARYNLGLVNQAEKDDYEQKEKAAEDRIKAQARERKLTREYMEIREKYEKEHGTPRLLEDELSGTSKIIGYDLSPAQEEAFSRFRERHFGPDFIPPEVAPPDEDFSNVLSSFADRLTTREAVGQVYDSFFRVPPREAFYPPEGQAQVKADGTHFVDQADWEAYQRERVRFSLIGSLHQGQPPTGKEIRELHDSYGIAAPEDAFLDVPSGLAPFKDDGTFYRSKEEFEREISGGVQPALFPIGFKQSVPAQRPGASGVSQFFSPGQQPLAPQEQTPLRIPRPFGVNRDFNSFFGFGG
jgi:hypothetical protein